MADPVSIPPPNYTQIPNAILDLMADMSDAELRVVMAIARQTFGWHKKRDKISLTQLQKLTGMSRQGVVGGVAAGVGRGVIERTPDANDGRGGIWYRLLVNDVDQSSTLTSQQRDQSSTLTRTSQRRGLELVNGVDTQKKGKKTKETPPPPTPAALDSPIGGGGEDRTNGKPNKTELYHWLRSHGVDSPAAAERNQHHDPEKTKAMYAHIVGDSIGADRKRLVGRFIRALDADGPTLPPPPAANGRRSEYTRPAPKDNERVATAAQLHAAALEQRRRQR